MQGVSIIIPVFNKAEVTAKCINHIREFNKKIIKIWSDFLPGDVITLREKFLYAFRSRQKQIE